MRFLPGWLDPRPSLSSLPTFLPRGVFHISMIRLWPTIEEKYLSLTPEFARSSENCAIALQAILVVVSPYHRVSLRWSLPRLTYFLVAAKMWCWGLWVPLLRGYLRCDDSHHAKASPTAVGFYRRPAMVSDQNVPSASPFLKRLMWIKCVHLGQNVRLRQSEPTLFVLQRRWSYIWYCFDTSSE